MQNTDKIWTIVDSKQADYIELSDRIFEMPELNYREVKSAAAHAEQLRREGFRVETGIAGLPTAVMGEAGEEGPVIAILGALLAEPGTERHLTRDTIARYSLGDAIPLLARATPESLGVS